MTRRKINLNSAHSFKIIIWSKQHYKKLNKPKSEAQIYNGSVVNNKTKKDKKFHSPAELLRILEDFYFKEEKKI